MSSENKFDFSKLPDFDNLPLNESKGLDEFYIQAVLLSKVIRRILETKGDIIVSKNPVFNLKNVTEFMDKLRVSSLSKFEETTYISTVNFYKSSEELENHNAIGALILYLPESYIPVLARKLQYPDVDEDDPEALVDACGTFCNLIAGNFKSGLTRLGYVELVMSHFSGYENYILEGVEFSPDQTQMYEIQFDISGERRIVIEFSMGNLPMQDI